MKKTDELLKLENSINELYEKYPKGMVNSFLERISEMTAEEFDATVKLCGIIDSVEADKQKDTTNQ